MKKSEEIFNGKLLFLCSATKNSDKKDGCGGSYKDKIWQSVICFSKSKAVLFEGQMYDKDKVAVLDFANDAPLFGFIKSVCYFKEEVYVLRDQFGLLSITKPTFKYFAPISGSSVFLFFVFFLFSKHPKWLLNFS